MTKSGKMSNQSPATPHNRGVALPVLTGDKTTIRPSRMTKWRTLSLVLVHVLIIVHVIQWLITGQTLSPIEPAEAMFTLNDGHLNAGFIFFTVAILATFIFGRYLCGWGCHFVAYQDISVWLLKKIRIKPKPFRSRFLFLAPLALAIYMFVWPTAYRLYVGAAAPETTNHLITAEFWNTFPGFWLSLLSVAICGFGTVYFFGAKGFCTYACPYGGFFAVADKVAPGRIRVSDACQHCGHCTAVCTSNVRVHEEVATYGMVVDPGCMKCMDCVSVCPNDALSFGFGKPAIAKSQTKTPKPRQFDFTLTEEVAMLVVGVAAILSYRGLYNQIPLLLAMGMAAMTALVLMKAWRLLVSTNVRFQNLNLKRGRRITRAGMIYALSSLALTAILAHSGFLQYTFWRAHGRLEALQLPDTVWSPGDNWWNNAPQQSRQRVTEIIHALETVNRIGITKTPSAMEDLVWLYAASGDIEAAETTIRELVAFGPDKPDFHRGLANVLRKQERFSEAEQSYRNALEADPSFGSARLDLAGLLREQERFDEAEQAYNKTLDLDSSSSSARLGLARMLQSQNRTDEAVELLRAGSNATSDKTKWPIFTSDLLSSLARFDDARAEIAPLLEKSPDDPDLLVAMGFIETRAGKTAAGVSFWQRALKIDPDRANIRYSLAMALLRENRIDEGIQHLQDLVGSHPNFIQARYNLAVALYTGGKLDQALPHAEKSLDLAPNDQKIKAFTSMLRNQTKATNPQPQETQSEPRP